jgi:hypothetical protein
MFSGITVAYGSCRSSLKPRKYIVSQMECRKGHLAVCGSHTSDPETDRIYIWSYLACRMGHLVPIGSHTLDPRSIDVRNARAHVLTMSTMSRDRLPVIHMKHRMRFLCRMQRPTMTSHCPLSARLLSRLVFPVLSSDNWIWNPILVCSAACDARQRRRPG